MFGVPLANRESRHQAIRETTLTGEGRIQKARLRHVSSLQKMEEDIQGLIRDQPAGETDGLPDEG